jgi:hypothetical protein
MTRLQRVGYLALGLAYILCATLFICAVGIVLGVCTLCSALKARLLRR